MKSINLDISHRCTLECPRCQRNYYRSRGERVPGSDLTVSEYAKLLDFFDEIRICGNISDPVFNPNFITFLEMSYEKKVPVKIHHAATGKPLSWYKQAFEANPDAFWVFAIDGLPKDSHKYRINQKGEQLFEALKLCNEMGLKCVWAHIIFRYNEDTLGECQKLADENNIRLVFVKSGRWQPDDPYKPLRRENYL